MSFLLLTLLTCCRPEPELELYLVLKNDLTQPIRINFYYSFPEQILDSTLLDLHPNEVHEELFTDRGRASAIYPSDLHGIFPPSDSVRIYYNDTIFITHVLEVSHLPDTNLLIPVIYFNEFRNIFNQDSYIKEKIDDNAYRGTYSISQSDLDYASSVYE